MASRNVESSRSSLTIESSAHTYISPDSDRARPRYNRLEPTSLEMAQGVLLTDRSLAEYLEILDITPSHLGTRVLDIGSGLHELFSRQASLLNIAVISINPQLSGSHTIRAAARESFKDFPAHQGRSLGALTQALPFPEDCFDSVVSVFAIPFYLKPKLEEYQIALSEIFRVLKPQGCAYLAPLDTDHLLVSERILNEHAIPYSAQRVQEEVVKKITVSSRRDGTLYPLPPFHRLKIEKDPTRLIPAPK